MSLFIDLLLKPSIEMSLDRLIPKEIKEFAILVKIDDKLEELKTMMSLIRGVLHDAQQKQITDRAVSDWVQQLTHLAYDIDDLFDKLNTDARRLKLAKESLSSLREFWSKATQINKIKALTERLDQVAKQREVLGLNQGFGESSVRVSQRPPTSSLVQPSHVYGREKDLEQILEWLSSDATGNSNFSVTSIVGLGGAGKTTLAQLLYNHEKLKDLEPKGWVCVSDGRFDVTRITKAIIESITGTSPDLTELQPLQDRLKDLLNEKKFLIVLDDVWNQNSSDWHALRAPFEFGGRGSKILVTTRSTQVSSMMGSVHTYPINKLSEEDSLSLFNHHAFENGSPDAHPEFKSIAEKIVKKCDGLPLAVKALGGILCGQLDIAEWELVLNSEIWELAEDKSVDILPSLKVSYHYLPAHLKQCFSYCAIFPQDHIFDKKELVLLWMAEGFLQPKGDRRMEDVGDDYFRELLSRSFFQKERRGFVMHDLMHDLARYVSRGICFHFRDGLEDGNSSDTDMSLARYALVAAKIYLKMSRLEVLNETKNLRTLKFDVPYSYARKPLPEYLFLRLQCLRVLCLNRLKINFELPESIGKLMHLRYLDLSATEITKLPVSMSMLLNLQTLFLRYCSRLTDLVSDMGNLIELRHLDIHCCSELTRMPQGMSKLTNLQTLSCFVVGANSGSSIEGLKDMKQLRDELYIFGLKNVVNSIHGAILGNKEHIDELELNWGFPNGGGERESFESTDEAKETATIEDLQPHTNLKRLSVKCYYGTTFPSWLGCSSYSQLENLKLIACRRCQLLPSLGCLPSLRYLLIEGLWGVKIVGAEFYGSVKPFPSLETLAFKGMSDWEEWLGIEEEREEVFPRLFELEISNCPQLRKFSHQFVMLEKLVIWHCPKLVALPRCLPVLCTLEVNGCDAMVLRSVVDSAPPPLSYLIISRILNLKNLLVPLEEEGSSLLGYLNSLEELEITKCGELVKLSSDGVRRGMQCLASLRTLTIDGCPQLVCLSDDEDLLPLQSLTHLDIGSCPRLVKLSSDGVRRGTQCLASLRTLRISQCPQLVCLLDDEDLLPLQSLTHLYIYLCPRLHIGKLNSKLEKVRISSCRTPNIRMMNCTSLQKFKMCGLPDLVSIEGKIEFPLTLKKLRIAECPALETFPAQMVHNSNNSNNYFLDELEIRECGSLTSFTTSGSSSSTGFPFLPKRLIISDCENLLSLPERMILGNRFLASLCITGCYKLTSLPEGMYELPSLRELSITGCPSLVSFPKEGLPTTLTRLVIEDCASIQSLPNGLRSVTSLQTLSIIACSNLDPLPEGGFPCNLQEIRILNKVRTKPIFEWGLHRLTSLRTLEIVGFLGLVYFPVDVLPPGLTTLIIANFPDLHSLPEKLHTLTSLEVLEIHACENLAALPQLPCSLGHLVVGGCPMLKQRCVEEKGEDWPKIADIPYIHIQNYNGMRIQ